MTSEFEIVVSRLDADVDTFWYDGHIYKKKPIYKGWYRTGYEWVIDE